MLLDCIGCGRITAQVFLSQKKTRSCQGGLSLSVCLRALASDRPPRGGNNHAGGAHYRLHVVNLPYRRLYVNSHCTILRPFPCLRWVGIFILAAHNITTKAATSSAIFAWNLYLMQCPDNPLRPLKQANINVHSTAPNT